MKKVFYTKFKTNRVEWVRRVGIKARETNNIVERLHGFKGQDKTDEGLEK